MSKKDDSVPVGYPYAWSPDSELSLQEFLTKYKPSMVQDDGTKPWLWVVTSTSTEKDSNVDTAVEEAAAYLEVVTENVEEIKNDASIPIRSNKKKGLKSKKELREAVQSEASGKFKEISIRHGFVSGKWLIFAPTDKVDLIWSTIATSLVSGPLASTSAYSAKVATCPQNETPNYSHVLCLYMPDVYDQDSVTETMRILLRKHGMNLMGVKSNLYTAIGLDSKHASGIPSTVWKNTALLKDSEIKTLKDEFFAELNAGKNARTEQATLEGTATHTSASSKHRPKKKAAEDDPFASDEDEKGDNTRAANPNADQVPDVSASTKAFRKPKKSQGGGFASEKESEDDAVEEEKRKAEVRVKKATTTTKITGAKRQKDDDDDAEGGERPKKRL